MVDFRPFAAGIDLRKAKADCAADAPLSETIFTYKNNVTNRQVMVHSNILNSYLNSNKIITGTMEHAYLSLNLPPRTIVLSFYSILVEIRPETVYVRN